MVADLLFPAAGFLATFLVTAFLVLLLGVAAFWGVTEADPATAGAALVVATALLVPTFFALLGPVDFLAILLVPVAFLVLLTPVAFLLTLAFAI